MAEEETKKESREEQKTEPKNKAKKKKKSPKKVELIRWYYDNGDIGSVLKGKKGYFHEVTLKSDAAINKEIEWLTNRKKKSNLKIKDEIIYELPAGISAYITQYKQNASWGIHQRRAALEEFTKMIRATGTEDARQLMVKLTAVVLSGYWIRLALEIPDIRNAYPIDDIDAALCAYITKCEDPDSFTALKRICDSIMVSTKKRKDKHFKVEAPTLLPDDKAKDLISTAWLTLRDDKKEHVWPAPYRDMAVLWDRAFLNSSKELKGFMDRNPWCTCLIFGKKIPYSKRIVMDLKGKGILDRVKVDWDGKQVKKLVAAYVAYMPGYFRGDGKGFLQIWDIAGAHLKCHLENEAKKETRSSECFRDRILLSACISFMEFVYKTCQMPLDEARELQKELLTALLPGCYPKGTQEKEAAKKSSREQFEAVLQMLITEENLKHFYPLRERGEIWPERTEDGTDIWGFVRKFEDKESGALIPCVVFIRDGLIACAKERCPLIPSFPEILTQVRKERPSYLHQTQTCHIRRREGGQPESKNVYRLNIEDEALPIPEACRRKMLGMLK